MAKLKRSEKGRGQQKLLPLGIGRARSGRAKSGAVTASARVFNGDQSSRDGLFINGKLDCAEVHHAKHVTVAEHARVRANIQANSVVISGHLIGNIYSDGKVSLDRYSDVTGNIVCSGIVIADGARFTGRIDMEELTSVTTMSNVPVTGDAVRTLKARPHIAKPGIYA